jgi:hypothetical protein
MAQLKEFLPINYCWRTTVGDLFKLTSSRRVLSKKELFFIPEV